MARIYKIIFLCFAMARAFSQTALPDIDLSGPWRARVGDGADWADPALDDGAWAWVDLPASHYLRRHQAELFPEGKKAATAYVWFRREFLVDGPPASLAWFQAREIQNADQVYLNGILIGSTGSFPPEFHSGWRSMRNYPIDPRLFRTGRNVLAMRVFSDAEDWVTGPLRITARPSARYAKALSDFLRIDIFSYFFVLLLWVAFYFSIYFIRRPKEQEFLWFSLTCLSMACILLVWFYDNRFPFLGIPSNLIYAFCQAALFFFPPLLSLFVHSYLHRRVRRPRLILSLLGPALGSLILLFSLKRPWMLAVRSVFLALQPAFIGVIWADLFLALRRRMPRALGLSAVVVPLTLLSFRDILAYAFGMGTDGSVFFVYGMPPVFFLFALQFIQQFVRNLDHTEKLKTSFYRFVPVEFLRLIGRPNPDEVALGDSATRDIAVMFADIRQFTRTSESMDPQIVFGFLNDYLSRMVPVIREHSGYVDKYIGDAIMALFPARAYDALAAALGMQRALAAFNAEQEARGMRALSVSMGIHYGRLVLGTIGSGDRLEGTVIADAVNLASRIESLTRYYGCDILISGDVREAAAALPPGSLLRWVDRVSVAGRSSIVELYELLWDPQGRHTARASSLDAFIEGMGFYQLKDLEGAKARFAAVMAADPEDGPAQVWLKRVEQVMEGSLEWADHMTFHRK